jgi:hypothetical protein
VLKLNIYDFYITPEEYERAAQIGITAKTLDKRIRYRGWDKEKAITTPPRMRKEYPKEILELAKRNGICVSTLRTRVNQLGWDMHKAATEPIEDKRITVSRAYSKNRKYPREYIERARINGIPDYVFYDRVSQYGWSLEDASTKPVMTSREIGLMTKEKRQKSLDAIFARHIGRLKMEGKRI